MNDIGAHATTGPREAARPCWISLSLSLSLSRFFTLTFFCFVRSMLVLCFGNWHSFGLSFLTFSVLLLFFSWPHRNQEICFFSSVEDGDFQLKPTRIFSPAWRSVVDRERERLGNTKVGPIKNEKKLLKASHTSDRVAFNITESLFLSYRESSVNGTIISQHRLKWSEEELGRPHRPLYIES